MTDLEKVSRLPQDDRVLLMPLVRTTRVFWTWAGLMAAIHVRHLEQDHPVHVLMPYADALRPLAAWFVQLWAESLGKRTDRQGEVIEAGPPPLPAVGATDQHGPRLQ